MINLVLDGTSRRILALGAHCDDIEIGCGATMLRLAANPDVDITWVVFSSNPERAAEATRSAGLFLGEADNRRLVIEEFRDGYLPWSGAAVKDSFERLKGEIEPDIVFTHYRHDLHQDHRLVSELTWNTFRDHLILEYEIPKWDGDIGNPNAYLPVSSGEMDQKIQSILDSYRSQDSKAWFTEDLFRSLSRIRGMECASQSGFAEAFYARKLVLGA